MKDSAADVAQTAEEWSRSLLANCCPVCGRGPVKVVMDHLAQSHGLHSAEVRLAAGWPSFEREKSVRVRENWRRLGSHERDWKLRGLKRDHSAASSAGARKMQATRSPEMKAATAARLNANSSARVRRMWAAMTPEERSLRTAPARAAGKDRGITAPGRYALLPAEVKSRNSRAGQKAGALKRRRAAERRRIYTAIERIEATARSEERDLIREERAERAGLLRRLSELMADAPVDI